jgi:oxygen-independent coproporphyrinogen-3 oxidase
LDLIFGWPEQTPEQWRADLETVLGWAGEGPDHLSLYSLIVEPGTPFADAVQRGIWQVPDDDATADLYESAIALLDEAGWDHYEVANWAKRPDHFSRHNALYWQHGDYLGFGAGAHGHQTGTRTMNHLLPETYVAAVTASEPTVSNSETLDAATLRGETMMLGLRLLHDGVDADAFAARHGVALDDVYGETIAELTELGLLEPTGHGVRLTHRGLMLANDVAARFL